MKRIQGIDIYSVADLDIPEIVRAFPRVINPPGNPGHKDRKTIVDAVCAFDIESTSLEDIQQAFMYVWQFQLGPWTVMGRTWEEFLTLLKRIKAGLKSSERLVCHVHNLSYEFQFLKGIYPFKKNEVFCLDRRKIARCEMFQAVEFRCSYIHSNMSLDQYTKKMGCTSRKLTGTFDYKKIRYPWTELTVDEILYCVYDVISLTEALTREMDLDNDTLVTLPLTSTGYVRRKCKTAMRSKTAFYSYISDQLPDYELFVALREAFRGGNTHANRFYVGKTVENVKSVDRSSSYPDVLVNHEFPVSTFVHRGPCSMDRFFRNKNDHKRACLIRLALFNVKLKDPWIGCPYLSKDKCTNVIGAFYDNGRILCAQYLECTITDIDYDIIESMYTWENPCVFDSWFARYGKLPHEFTDVIIAMYKDKTMLKGNKEQAVYYGKIKAMINALYGMTAQNPLKLSFEFYDNEYHEKNEDPAKTLQKYNRKAFLVYQWGVWVTAWARWELQRMIDIAGNGVTDPECCFIYCDTDSVKYVGDIEPGLTEYNQAQEALSISNGGYAVDSKGEYHYLGVYEVDEQYKEFRTLGAKKYAYTDDDGHCHVTVAGVVKSAGGKELDKAGGLDAFKDGFVFREAGGMEAVYNDNIRMILNVDGHELLITDNVYIHDGEYTLGLTGEYKYLLNHVEFIFDLWSEWKREKDLDKYSDND